MSEPRSSPHADVIWSTMVRRHRALAEVTPFVLGTHEPSVAVLACSDARVPPSLLFGQEPGSLFVVRLAGNSATRGAIASLTYATEALGVELVVVLGHTGCGAVTAALEQADTPGDATLSPVLDPIVEMLDAFGVGGDVDAAVRANVTCNVERLIRDLGPLGDAIRRGRVTVRGAVHDLATGTLHPTPIPELIRSTP